MAAIGFFQVDTWRADHDPNLESELVLTTITSPLAFFMFCSILSNYLSIMGARMVWQLPLEAFIIRALHSYLKPEFSTSFIGKFRWIDGILLARYGFSEATVTPQSHNPKGPEYLYRGHEAQPYYQFLV